MTHRPLDRVDLTDAWPDESGNEELARLGQELFAGSPALPQIALDRIQVQMRAEIIRVERQRFFRRFLLGAVACLALAAGVWLVLNRPHGGGPANSNSQPTATPVRDRFDVTLPPSSPKSPEKPLLDPNRDADLFGKKAPGK